METECVEILSGAGCEEEILNGLKDLDVFNYSPPSPPQQEETNYETIFLHLVKITETMNKILLFLKFVLK